MQFLELLTLWYECNPLPNVATNAHKGVMLRKRFRRLLTFLFSTCLLGRCLSAAEWQWSVPVESVVSEETGAHPRAFLYIPPNVERVRAVIVGQHNMLEEGILEHPALRRALAETGMAAVWVSPAFNGTFQAGKDAGEHFEKMMAALAKESGYEELALAPAIPIGHSAMAGYPYHFAAWNPQRCAAAISIKGAVPEVAGMDGVPLLYINGEYEDAQGRAGKAAAFRAKQKNCPLTMWVDAGGGHFDFHDRIVEAIGFYLRKVAQYRLLQDAPLAGPVALREIDATKTGWVYDRWRKNEKPKVAPAPVGSYAGDLAQTFWAFDEETAKKVEAYNADALGKKVPVIGYVQNGEVVAQNPKLHAQVPLKFLPVDDGLTFKLTAKFIDKVPEGRPVSWTGLPKDAPVGHPAGGGPIRIERIAGPMVQLAPDTFAIRFYRMGMNNAKRSNDLWFMAAQPGDAEYRRMVQQAQMQFPLRNTVGAEQAITFPEIADQPVGAEPLQLPATSSAKVPVYYYVREGPAEVTDDGTLTFTPLPPRAKFPVRVTVVAWQWGRSIEPKLQTAEPVERTFLLTRNASAAVDASPAKAVAFTHPGLLHTQADLDRMRQRVAAGEEPWKSGFEKLRRDGQSRADWKLRGPFEIVTRQADQAIGNPQMVVDGNAAYQNALMWCVTGDEAHARKAVEILNAWSAKLRRMDGRDVILSAGLNGFKFVNAAELLRHTWPAWPREDVARCERMLKEVVLPPIKDFATFANGNWDAACVATVMGIGVFCDDRELFDRAVAYFRSGAGNGRLTHYVINEVGQCQESGRDQQHTQLGLGLLAEACEIAWHQGVDLYAEEDNRLLKGFEYTARYNLGAEVPFVPYVDVTGKYRHKKISTEGRYRLRPIYEMVWSHYQVRRGVPAPFTKQAADKLRPEGAASTGDHPGFGTLLFTLPAKAPEI